MHIPHLVLLWLMLQPVWLWAVTPQFSNPEKKCIRVFLEIDYSIYTDKEDYGATEAFAGGLFREVAALYEQEGIQLQLAGLYIWEEPGPYTGKTSSVLLGQFQRQRLSFEGDMALLLTHNILDGMSVTDALCRPVPSLRMGVAGIEPGYAPFPTYSASVYSLAHQIGHLLGSQHTNACVWNGDGSAIDASQGFTEGDCPLPAGSYAAGTLMYSCHPPATGIDFQLGLGQQAGDLLRRKVAEAAPCLSSCPAPEKEEPNADCVRRYYMDLTLDYFASETSWQLENESGETIASGGDYSNNAVEVTVRDTFCLPEGCYTFSIRDTYADGICCEYGQGRLVLYDESGDTLATADKFGAHRKIEFCASPEISPLRQSPLTHRQPPEPPSRLRLMPNPASAVLRLSTHLPKEGSVRIQLYTLSGKRILLSQNYGFPGSWQTELQVAHVPPGIYLVRLEQGAFRQTERVVINR